MMGTLRDVLPNEPRILFVGINPGLRSGALGHHFAGPGNPFWRLLYATGLVPEPVSHEDDRRLGAWGLGITNLCPRSTRMASELSPEEIARGRKALLRKIRRVRPRVVALVGVTLDRYVFGKPTGTGAGPRTETLEGARVFVLPNPSGLNASYPGFEHKRVWFERLREFADGC